MRARARASMAAELRRLTRDGRYRWILACSLLVSFGGGLVHAAIAAGLTGVEAIELQTAVISRGAATPLGVVLLMVVAIAGPYRDGSWLHAALAEPRASRRLLVSAVPIGAACAVVAVASAAAATAGAAVMGRIEPPSIMLSTALHLAVTQIWALWMLCLAHATRSPMLTLAIGAGLPILIEPATAGLLTQADLGDLRLALPGQALRALAELPATGGALLQPVPAEALPLAIVTIVICTGAAAASAWLRLRRPQPR